MSPISTILAEACSTSTGSTCGGGPIITGWGAGAGMGGIASMGAAGPAGASGGPACAGPPKTLL
jgi:hypothetical protein